MRSYFINYQLFAKKKLLNWCKDRTDWELSTACHMSRAFLTERTTAIVREWKLRQHLLTRNGGRGDHPDESGASKPLATFIHNTMYLSIFLVFTFKKSSAQINFVFLFKIYSWGIKYFMYKMVIGDSNTYFKIARDCILINSSAYLWINYNIYTVQTDPCSFNYNLITLSTKLNNSDKT